MLAKGRVIESPAAPEAGRPRVGHDCGSRKPLRLDQLGGGISHRALGSRRPG